MSDEKVVGGCACGAVRFEGRFPSRFAAHCHCLNCTRAHGAAFVTWVGFIAEQFRWTAGEDQIGAWHTPTGATRSFCYTCGTTMTFSSPRWAGEMHVALATCDGPIDRPVSAHAYADRARDWCPITDDLPRFGGEDGTTPL